MAGLEEARQSLVHKQKYNKYSSDMMEHIIHLKERYDEGRLEVVRELIS